MARLIVILLPHISCPLIFLIRKVAYLKKKKMLENQCIWLAYVRQRMGKGEASGVKGIQGAGMVKAYAVDVLDEVVAQLVVDLCGLLAIRALLDIMLQGENFNIYQQQSVRRPDNLSTVHTKQPKEKCAKER